MHRSPSAAAAWTACRFAACSRGRHHDREGGRRQGRCQGGRGPRYRRQGRRDDRAAATCPDGGPHRQGQGAVVGEVGGGSWQGEREHPGERAGEHRRDRLARRCDLGSAVWSWPTGRTCRAAWTCRPHDDLGLDNRTRPISPVPLSWGGSLTTGNHDASPMAAVHPKDQSRVPRRSAPRRTGWGPHTNGVVCAWRGFPR